MNRTSHKIAGVLRKWCNSYDYVRVSHDGESIMISASEGSNAPGYADLTPKGARKLIAALEAILAEMEAGK